MKGTVFFILMAGVAGCIFCYPHYNFLTPSGNEIYKIILQALLSGTFTFAGLFITISNQDIQQNRELKRKRCPCFIVKPTEVASNKSNYVGAKDDDVIKCHENMKSNDQVRTIRVAVVNAKNDSWALNCSLNRYSLVTALEANKAVPAQLLLWADSGEFELHYSDLFGLKYKQKIKYTYRKGNYVFTSMQPKRKWCIG